MKKKDVSAYISMIEYLQLASIALITAFINEYFKPVSSKEILLLILIVLVIVVGFALFLYRLVLRDTPKTKKR